MKKKDKPARTQLEETKQAQAEVQKEIAQRSKYSKMTDPVKGPEIYIWEDSWDPTTFDREVMEKYVNPQIISVNTNADWNALVIAERGAGWGEEDAQEFFDSEMQKRNAKTDEAVEFTIAFTETEGDIVSKSLEMYANDARWLPGCVTAAGLAIRVKQELRKRND